MAQHMLTPPDVAYTDKRRSSAGASVADGDSRHVGKTHFTANGAGTTTTIVGADATLATGVNVVRVGDKYKVYNSDGTIQEETVVTVTSVASSAGTTTVTFTPALSGATASGDVLKTDSPNAYNDNNSLDARLTAIDATLYSQANLDKMTQNDKVYALRVNDDPLSL